jgi:hypothetical protein
VQVRAVGGSMRGRIESGQLVTLAPALHIGSDLHTESAGCTPND